jgi:lipopolysaccharide export system protein LptA
MSGTLTTRRYRRTVVAALAVMLALASSSAFAQKTQTAPPNALQGFSQNRDEPVKIKAISLEVRDKERMATFSGDVHVVQGDTEMRCKQLVVLYDEDPNTKAAKGSDSASKQIRRIEAKGGVTVTQKEQKASGDSGIFDMQGNTVTLIGNVIVTRGTDVLRGQRLFVDLGSGRTTLDSGPGRVEGLFQPSRSSEKR